MRKPFDQLRVLLLQARATEDMELQEQACFMERSMIESHQLIPVNVVRHRLHPGLLDGMDAFMIGGAGEFSATKEYVWMGDALDLIRAAVDRGIPTFGSCWGHQMLARAFGGRVLHDHARAEMGCHGVELTGAGIRDDLFSGFPGRFLANMGHHDRVVTLPPGAVELAFNASQPNQAFRLDGTVAYGTQFHTELDAHRERERLIRYRSYYVRELASEESFQAILASLAETTEVDHLLHDFLVAFAAAAPPATP
jgi:GMP synthase (glutamine-hydrolysing)